MRTGTLALFRDFHDNRPAQDPHNPRRNVEENGQERKEDGDGDGPEKDRRGCTTNLFLWRSGKSTLVIQRFPEGRLFHVSYGAICLMISSSGFAQPPATWLRTALKVGGLPFGSQRLEGRQINLDKQELLLRVALKSLESPLFLFIATTLSGLYTASSLI